jgi:outer membrane receptor protein involved in Fe transport
VNTIFLLALAAPIFNGLIGAPESVGDITFGYERGPWYFRFGATWVSAMDDYEAFGEDPATSPFILSTPDYYLYNASVQFHADGWQLTVGARNLADEEPPRVSSVEQRIGESPIFSGFDYIGRQIFVNVSTIF